MPPSSIQPNSDAASLATPGRLRVAYLLSRYPGISHTFFLKEIVGLRDRGMEIHAASVNPPDRPIEQLPVLEAEEAKATFYLKSGRKLTLLGQVVRVALQNPAATWRGVRAASGLGGWDLKARCYSILYLAEALLIGDWMRRKALNHLHVHFGGPVATVGLLAAQSWQVPWSLTLHGPDEFFDQDAFYLRQKIESASFVICISDFCRSQVLRVAPKVNKSRLEIVRLGVDCDSLQPSRDNPSLPSVSSQTPTSTQRKGNSLRIVCTGRMVAAKGHRILLEAIASLIGSGIAVTCVLIGDGEERGILEAQCRESGIAGHVHFLGALAHQPTLEQVARADVFVLASFAEGLPVALMEAMALGVPCVSTIIAAIPELIRDQKNGLLVPAANTESLINALLRLAVDPELRHKLGLEARKTVESEYNLAKNLDRLATLWTRRLGSGR